MVLRRPIETKLAATIAVMDQPAPMQRPPLMQCLFQRIEYEACRAASRRALAEHLVGSIRRAACEW
jgi:hypothetical protein